MLNTSLDLFHLITSGTLKILPPAPPVPPHEPPIHFEFVGVEKPQQMVGSSPAAPPPLIIHTQAHTAPAPLIINTNSNTNKYINEQINKIQIIHLSSYLAHASSAHSNRTSHHKHVQRTNSELISTHHTSTTLSIHLCQTQKRVVFLSLHVVLRVQDLYLGWVGVDE